ncbi:MAG: DapH/DapD/GlmU-related protein [Desulfobacteraceae bacterium]|nr:DapH/DapD/GlmU-related protein [Desulfobacteraceae bacterium]
MNIPLTKIINFLSDDLLEIKGENAEKIVIKHLKEPTEVDEFTLDWINPGKENKQQIAECTKAKAILVDEEMTYSEILKQQGKTLLTVKNPKFAIAQIANEFFVEKITPQIHPTASIHPKAKIGKNVFIGPYCIIGNCTIGNNVTIEGNNYLYDNVVIGNQAEIHAGAIIGNEAHNFVENENGEKIKFPHLGKTIIGNHVVIGAQSVISRGVLSNTIIGDNTKIAQLVFIGANNRIGKNCVIRPNAMTSGSVQIGNNSVIAPSATIREQRKIGKNCFIGMGAVVTKDVPDGETWIGNPARKLR